MNCYFYILYSPVKGKYYIGHTCDTMESRLSKHNARHKGFTGHEDDWQIVYYESFLTKEAAYSREREVKKWKSKGRVERLISGD